MNTLTLILYLFTWLLALLFFLLWRSEQGERIYQETINGQMGEKLEQEEKRAEYYRHRFEVDEMLLKDPELRFVGNCEGCAKVEDENGEPCKVLLSFENIVKSNYCSEFKRKVSDGSNIQTTTRPPIPRTSKRYEGTLGRIERERGASVGDSDQHDATPDEGRGNIGDDDRPE